MTMKSLAASTSQRTQLHRLKVSFNVEKNVNTGDDEDENMAAKDGDPLPIVELKPFVQKVWRREKSFANTWERSPSVNTIKSDKSDQTRATTGSRAKDAEVTSSITFDSSPDDFTTLSPPPRTSHSLPSRISERLLTFYVNAFEDFKSQKEHFNKFVGESGFRPKSRLHPVIDPKTKKQAEHAVSIIPGFITREDRTKTTLLEISEGDSTSRLYSCSPKAIGPDEIQKQQQIRISGETVYHFKRSPVPNSPTPTKSLNTSWHVPSVRHGSPASMLYHHKKDNKTKRTKTPLYDNLDRTGALPSLSINATSLKRKSTKKSDDANSEDYMDYRDAFESEIKHNIGGIENSLLVLSKHGIPTKVERQISFELEKNLSRFRKLKDYSPFEINPSELAKYYPQPTFNMTQGEAYIRQAMQSNTSKKRQRKLRQMANGKGKPFHAASEIQSSPLVHGILKKSFNEIEHIDSFENMYSPYNKLSNITYTPDDEPNAPYDTPRSHVLSRAQSKGIDSQILDKGNSDEIALKSLKSKSEVTGRVLSGNVGTSKQPNNNSELITHVIVADTETQTPMTPTLDNKREEPTDQTVYSQRSVKDEGMETESETDSKGACLETELNNAIDVKAVHMKTAQPPTTQIDASGRTFLTSDHVIQMALVTS